MYVEFRIKCNRSVSAAHGYIVVLCQMNFLKLNVRSCDLDDSVHTNFTSTICGLMPV